MAIVHSRITTPVAAPSLELSMVYSDTSGLASLHKSTKVVDVTDMAIVHSRRTSPIETLQLLMVFDDTSGLPSLPKAIRFVDATLTLA